MSEKIETLGRLIKVDLRSYWKKEDTEFTPWLALEENIQLLGETIGIQLEVLSQEENVGPFRADILCKDTISNHFVLIENQLERTDHLHLGQLMTYAAGLDAVHVIWISSKFTEEHRAALDWLNRITNDTFNFFGIEIELYRIGDSKPAPKFNLISKPNDWSKSVRKSAASPDVTDTKLAQQQYWQALKNYIEEKKSFIKMQSPPAQHWTNIAIGKTGFDISPTINSRDHVLSISLNIYGENAKVNYDKLYNLGYEGSLKEISDNIMWDRMDNKVQSIIKLTTTGNYTNPLERQVQFEWFREYIERFLKYFKPLLKNF